MAIITLSPFIDSIGGLLGSLILEHSEGSTRVKAATNGHQSEYSKYESWSRYWQSTQRSSFENFLRNWLGLTNPERDLWNLKQMMMKYGSKSLHQGSHPRKK